MVKGTTWQIPMEAISLYSKPISDLVSADNHCYTHLWVTRPRVLVQHQPQKSRSPPHTMYNIEWKHAITLGTKLAIVLEFSCLLFCFKIHFILSLSCYLYLYCLNQYTTFITQNLKTLKYRHYVLILARTMKYIFTTMNSLYRSQLPADFTSNPSFHLNNIWRRGKPQSSQNTLAAFQFIHLQDSSGFLQFSLCYFNIHSNLGSQKERNYTLQV